MLLPIGWLTNVISTGLQAEYRIPIKNQDIEKGQLLNIGLGKIE